MTLSLLLFLTQLCQPLPTLRAHQHLGYNLSGSNVTTNLLLYADDTCLIADGPASCQNLLLQVEKWLQWTGLSMKIPKCFYLNLQASTAKQTPIHLHLQDQVIPPVGEGPFKFLGGPVSVPSSRKQHRQQLEVKLAMLLKRVDDTAVSRKQKLLLYKAGICPRLLWDLAIGDLPISSVTTSLEAMQPNFFKKWSGLAKPANTARLYLPQEDGGLALPPVSLLYKRMKLSHATLLLTSRDRVTQQVASRTLDKESSQRRAQFKPVTYSRNIMAENLGAHQWVLLKHVKNTANVEDATSRRKQAETLPLQGQMLRASNLTADGIWAVAVSKLGSEAMKFALNAASDTLPHNSNLARWYRGSCTDQCTLCGKKQTLLHVLNNCEVALNLRRYNMRHDRILQLIVTATQAYSPASYQLVADLRTRGSVPLPLPHHSDQPPP